jgi:hypothetical protein
MSKLEIEQCPETGICTVRRADGTKADLMPDEVEELRSVARNANALRAVMEEADPKFAAGLDADELKQLADEVK